MIIKSNKSNKVKIRESLILPRLVKVLENLEVTIILINGTKVRGTVESNGKKIKTISLKTALAELRISSKVYNDFNEYLSEDDQLQQIKDYCKSVIDNVPDINSKNTKNNNNFKIVGDCKSFVVLKEAKVEFNRKVIRASTISIPELHIATLRINSTNKSDQGPKNKLNKYDNNMCKMDIKKMIINWHKNEIKNEAFIRCSRIGSNNTKT